MTADTDGSGIAQGRPGAMDDPCRETGWRGPGWRVFDPLPEHGKEVRDWIAQVVRRHGCPADPGDVALVVSELFTNALLHGPVGGRVLVGYCLWRGGARIVVCDAGGVTAPRLRDPGRAEEGGRGLQVVNTIAASWGSFRAGHVQVVWCDLGQPLDSATAGDTWAWLRAVLATTPLAPTRAKALAACGLPA
jgi:anti-sigma regulatory factor (Ser/Thr protein kinase)